MSSRIRFLLPLAVFCLAPSAHATDLAYVKCAVNQDRVWVYESLGSFDVETRLRCGAPVEILSRVKGFVKIRTESGVEGFVADGAFPDLPPLADDSDKPAAAAAQSLAAAAAQRQPAAKPAPVPITANAPVPPPVITLEPAKIGPVVAPAPAPAAAPRPAMLATAAPSAPAPAPMPAKATIPVKPTASAASSAPAQTARISTASAKTKPAPAATAKKSERAFDSAPAAPLVHGAPAAPATAAPASVKPSVETVSDSMRETATYVPAAAMTDTKEEDSEDYPDTKPQNDSADPACRIFFAAYGLAPSQYKWFADDRRKEYSQICPAPDVAHVDYVVLFTHDSDSYNYALPVPVHTDHNGFSDFSALTTVDTALMTASEVQKARYEFVWVFRVKRGEFDPARFSARRKPQFTTYVKGSRASARAIEDAFNFVQTQSDH